MRRELKVGRNTYRVNLVRGGIRVNRACYDMIEFDLGLGTPGLMTSADLKQPPPTVKTASRTFRDNRFGKAEIRVMLGVECCDKNRKRSSARFARLGKKFFRGPSGCS
jgi:hypothetical protein